LHFSGRFLDKAREIATEIGLGDIGDLDHAWLDLLNLEACTHSNCPDALIAAWILIVNAFSVQHIAPLNFLLAEDDDEVSSAHWEDTVEPLIDNTDDAIILDNCSGVVHGVVLGSFFDVEDVVHNLLHVSFEGGLALRSEVPIVVFH
jgi:hypothetical protein